MLELIKFLVQGVVLGGAGFGVTYLYSKRQQQLAEDEFNHTLLMRFNDWYDELNDKLLEIEQIENNRDDISVSFLREERFDLYNALNDYLNLCAEEKLWHSKGRIDPRIWNSWKAGMKYWYLNLNTLQELWSLESTTTNKNSYYLERDDELFPFN